MPPAYSSLTSAVTTYNPRWETFEEKRKREERELTEWNDSHSAELCVVFTSPPFYSLSHASVFFSLRSNPAKAKEKHKFTHGKGCAELNTDRFADAEKVSKKETSARYEASLTLYCFPRARFQVESDNWVGGFYMEVYVDGWDVDKTITLDFHTPDIEFPKHACQVRVPPPPPLPIQPSHTLLLLLSFTECARRRLLGDDRHARRRPAAMDLLRVVWLRSPRRAARAHHFYLRRFRLASALAAAITLSAAAALAAATATASTALTAPTPTRHLPAVATSSAHYACHGRRHYRPVRIRGRLERGGVRGGGQHLPHLLVVLAAAPVRQHDCD